MSVHEEHDLVTAAIDGDAEAVETALRSGDINAADTDGWTALHIAARSGNTDMARMLLAQPAIDVNAKNKWKSTSLMMAAGAGHLDVIALLLNHPRIQVDAKAEYYGRTALIEAAIHGHLNVVKTLVMHGADINATDKTRRNSALVEAIKHGHVNVATYLLRSGLVDFSIKDLRLQALIWASNRGDDTLRAEMDAAISNFFRSKDKAAS